MTIARSRRQKANARTARIGMLRNFAGKFVSKCARFFSSNTYPVMTYAGTAFGFSLTHMANQRTISSKAFSDKPGQCLVVCTALGVGWRYDPEVKLLKQSISDHIVYWHSLSLDGQKCIPRSLDNTLSEVRRTIATKEVTMGTGERTSLLADYPVTSNRLDAHET